MQAHTATQLTIKPEGYRFQTAPHAPRTHYKSLMRLGRVWPTTKAQARYYISCPSIDVLNYEDVQAVEALLNRHGFTGQYSYTKSGRWVRLVNNNNLITALKLEYSL